jgi:hypothetical protein
MIYKNLKLTSVLVCFLLGSNAFSQTKPDSLGLPGDNFDLYAALELFKKAETPEDFEKAINSNDNEVNHLDLDGDGKADYVSIVDKKDSDVYTLVLQVTVSASEIQNVAVIEVEKTGNNKTHVQIVGDEELYGKKYIIELKDETELLTAKKTVTHTSSGESDDNVYSTSDKSGFTSPDLQVIEPVITKVAHYMVEVIIVPLVKGILHNMLKAIIEEAIPVLKTQ